MKGVPKDEAPRLLANWDIAYENGHDLPTMMFNKAVQIFAEFPGMPYDKAMALAEIEAKAEYFDIDITRGLANLIRRYRPWEGKENHKAFMEMTSRWIEKRLGKPRASWKDFITQKDFWAQVILGKRIARKFFRERQETDQELASLLYDEAREENDEAK